jgi:crossover junction endodeoxyribonuclease RusA
MISVFVPGVPVPKGSSRAFVNKHTGRAIVTAANSKTKPWQQAVAGVVGELIADAPMFPHEPVCVSLEFVMPRPKSQYSKKGLKPNAPYWHTTKPDKDKLARAVGDALTWAGLWKDDSQDCCGNVVKRYGERPGVNIRVAELPPRRIAEVTQ